MITPPSPPPPKKKRKRKSAVVINNMAYHWGQNSAFEFDVVVYNFYLDLQLNIQVSYFSTLLVDLTLFVSRFNFFVRSIQHSSLRNSTFNFRKYPTASQSMRVSVGSANYQNTPLVGASKGSYIIGKIPVFSSSEGIIHLCSPFCFHVCCMDGNPK